MYKEGIINDTFRLEKLCVFLVYISVYMYIIVQYNSFFLLKQIFNNRASADHEMKEIFYKQCIKKV